MSWAAATLGLLRRMAAPAAAARPTYRCPRCAGAGAVEVAGTGSPEVCALCEGRGRLPDRRVGERRKTTRPRTIPPSGERRVIRDRRAARDG